MKPSYQGNAKPFVLTLFHEADRAQALPVLEMLEQRGLTLCYPKNLKHPKRVVKRACVVVAFLSAQSESDPLFERAILLAKTLEVPLVGVKLDEAPMQSAINSLLYTSNIIFAQRYETPSLLVERLMTAAALAHPKLTRRQIIAARHTALLLITGVVVILVAAGLFLYQRGRAEKQPANLQTETADIAGLLQSGMTEEDLQNIYTLILVGDNMIDPNDLGYYRDWRETVSMMEIDGELVWSIDGKQIPRGTAKDFSLIGRMTNLQNLVLLNQSVTDLSPLKSLTKLAYVEIADCPVESMEALSDKRVLQEVQLDRTQVTSLKPLESCIKLERFSCDMEHCASVDGIGNPALKELWLYRAEKLTNLDALSACTSLENLHIDTAFQLNDISGLAGCKSLSKLEMYDALALYRCDDLINLTELREVRLMNDRLSDLSPLKNARGLQRLSLEGVPVRSLEWTSGLNKLLFVEVHGTRLRSMDFLKNLGVDTLELHFSGNNFEDYSGLAAIHNYSYMHLYPKDRNLNAVLPYIADAKISTLHLYDCNGIDFAKLPPKIINLHITMGNLASLEGISALADLNTLHLEDVNRLSSLKGLAESEKLTRLTLQSCMRLTDYEELYQKRLANLELLDLPTPPDLSRLQMLKGGNLTLERMPAINDLTPLSVIQTQLNSLQIKDMTALRGLLPIRQMHVTELIVSPEFAEQAKQLREENAIDRYQIAYPENELWLEDLSAITLLSLEELDTLPDSILQRVQEVSIIGDCVLDPETQEWRDEWKQNKQIFYVLDRASGEKTQVGKGVIREIGNLSKLTNLQSLRLYDQPLTSLQGIQNLPDLRMLEVRKSPLSDASAAFTLTRLERLSLFNTGITSIQGVQNLSKLVQLDITGTQVEDLSPLNDCDFSYAMENGGLELQIEFVRCTELSPLSSIPGFADLNIGGHSAKTWLPYLEGKQVTRLGANHCELTNEQVALLAALPGLKELDVSWNEQITDLSPLLACPTLEKLIINRDNAEALASIQGKAKFAIEYRE